MLRHMHRDIAVDERLDMKDYPHLLKLDEQADRRNAPFGLRTGEPVHVRAAAASPSFHLAAEFTAADVQPGRSYFSNGAIVIDDVQLDAMAQAHIQATPELKAMAAAGDKSGAYGRALSAAAQGFTRYDGRSMGVAASSADNRPLVDKNSQDFADRITARMEADEDLKALAARDWSGAFSEATSRVARTVRFA